MSEAIKPTPGPWTVAGENAVEPDVMWGECFVAQCFGFSDPDEALANARLIAEAGTVHHETGLTPSQLVERVKELEEALRDMHNGWRYIRRAHGDLYGVGWDRCEEKARAALSKSLPNTVVETPT